MDGNVVAWKRKEIYTKFWSENLKRRSRSKDQGKNRRITTLKMTAIHSSETPVATYKDYTVSQPR